MSITEKQTCPECYGAICEGTCWRCRGCGYVESKADDRPDIDEAKRNMFAAMRAECTRPCIVCGKPVELPEDLSDGAVILFHLAQTFAPMVATCDDCDDGTDDQADRVVRIKGGDT